MPAHFEIDGHLFNVLEHDVVETAARLMSAIARGDVLGAERTDGSGAIVACNLGLVRTVVVEDKTVADASAVALPLPKSKSSEKSAPVDTHDPNSDGAAIGRQLSEMHRNPPR